MNKLSIALRVVESFALSIVIWFVGWLLYDTVDLWMWFDAMGFRNTLFILMVISFALVCELTRRDLTAPETQHNSPVPQGQPAIQELKDAFDELTKEVDEINKKLTDIKAFEPIVKKRAKTKKKTTKTEDK